MAEDLSNAPVAAEPSLRDSIAAAYTTMSSDEPARAAEPAPVQTQEAAPVDGTETEAEKAERLRDEKGRFAAKEAAAQGKAPEGTEPPVEGAKTYAGPPPGWTVAAKAEFEQLPAAVKESIAKREAEIDKGFAKLREYKALAPYEDYARQNNMPLPDLMQRYKAADDFLNRDPHNAILWFCQNYGVDPRSIAGHAQQNMQPGQQQHQQPAAQGDPAILQELHALKEMVYGDKRTQVSSQVERFASDPTNKYFDNVADQMVPLITQAQASGQPVDLKSIYETACWMNPEVRSALIKEQSTKASAEQAAKARQVATQARQSGASIAGGPAATPPFSPPNSDNLRALLEAGMAEQMGRSV